jgi:hypothetical protein
MGQYIIFIIVPYRLLLNQHMQTYTQQNIDFAEWTPQNTLVRHPLIFVSADHVIRNSIPFFQDYFYAILSSGELRRVVIDEIHSIFNVKSGFREYLKNVPALLA